MADPTRDPRRIGVYFDFISPYAYLGWRAIRAQAKQRDIAIDAVPVVFAALLEEGGQLGPAEIPAKRRFLIRDCMRQATRQDIPFAFPKHPFRSIDALRLSLPQVAGEHQLRLIDALFDACWGRGEDLSDRATLQRILDKEKLDGEALLAKIGEAETKAALRQHTEQAIAAGVFGVPSFAVRDEIVWGNDRLDDVLAIFDGKSAINEKQYASYAAQPLALTRKRRSAPPSQPRPAPPSQPRPPLPSQPIMAPDSTLPISTTPDPEVIARVAPIFTSAAFIEHLGIELLAAGTGWVEARLSVRPEHAQQDGFAHAGVMGTLADHCAGAAAATQLEADRTPLTVELKLNLLRPANGKQLQCRAQVLRAGRELSVVEAEVRREDGKLAAKATATIANVARSRLKPSPAS